MSAPQILDGEAHPFGRAFTRCKGFASGRAEAVPCPRFDGRTHSRRHWPEAGSHSRHRLSVWPLVVRFGIRSGDIFLEQSRAILRPQRIGPCFPYQVSREAVWAAASAFDDATCRVVRHAPLRTVGNELSRNAAETEAQLPNVRSECFVDGATTRSSSTPGSARVRAPYTFVRAVSRYLLWLRGECRLTHRRICVPRSSNSFVEVQRQSWLSTCLV